VETSDNIRHLYITKLLKMENLNKEQSDEKKYNEMMKPITYTSEYDK